MLRDETEWGAKAVEGRQPAPRLGKHATAAEISPCPRRRRRAEHLDGVRGTLDGDLVEEERVGLCRQVRTDHGQEGAMPFALVRQSVHECLPCWARLRPDDQVDVGDLVPITYQRFADEEVRCHNYLPIRMRCTNVACWLTNAVLRAAWLRGVGRTTRSRRLRVALTETVSMGC